MLYSRCSHLCALLCWGFPPPACCLTLKLSIQGAAGWSKEDWLVSIPFYETTRWQIGYTEILILKCNYVYLLKNHNWMHLYATLYFYFTRFQREMLYVILHYILWQLYSQVILQVMILLEIAFSKCTCTYKCLDEENYIFYYMNSCSCLFSNILLNHKILWMDIMDIWKQSSPILHLLFFFFFLTFVSSCRFIKRTEEARMYADWIIWSGELEARRSNAPQSKHNTRFS